MSQGITRERYWITTTGFGGPGSSRTSSSRSVSSKFSGCWFMHLASSRPDRRLHSPRPDRSMPSEVRPPPRREAREGTSSPPRLRQAGESTRPEPPSGVRKRSGIAQVSYQFRRIRADPPSPGRLPICHSSPRVRRGPGGNRPGRRNGDTDRMPAKPGLDHETPSRTRRPSPTCRRPVDCVRPPAQPPRLQTDLDGLTLRS